MTFHNLTWSNKNGVDLRSSLFSLHISPANSSRFGSSGNLSQTSSPPSDSGQEIGPGSELKESYNSFHIAGYRPAENGHHPANGHATRSEHDGLDASQEMTQSCSKAQKLNAASIVEKKSLKR